MRVFSNFKIQVIFRIFLIGAAIYGFMYLLLKTEFFISSFLAGLLVFYLIYNLIHYVDMTNRNLARFFQAVKHADFSQSFTGMGLGSSFRELNESLAEVIKEFHHYRAETEQHFRYLQTIVQHVKVGLIVYQSTGEVDLINSSAKKLLNVKSLKNIHNLGLTDENLLQKLLKLKPGGRTLVKIENTMEPIQLSISATEFRMRGRLFKLVTLQNIHGELEEKEMEAWQNMIRVLTHEIMNSITPISSLSSTVSNWFSAFARNPGRKGDELDDETVQDIQLAIDTINKRSQGLIHFVEAYRNLTLIPKPKFKIIPLKELFLNINKLMEPKFRKEKIKYHSAVDPDTLEITADPQLIEQVLINLLTNSLHAVEDTKKPVIRLTANMDEQGRTLIKVADNGRGIVKDAIDKIFIPFFTTKKKGSGIGLSLSRQILRLHNGTISVHSLPEKQTVFTLRF